MRTFLIALILLAAAHSGLAAAPGRNDVAPDDRVTTPALAEARLDRAAAAVDQGRYGDALNDIAEALESGLLSEAQTDWASYLKARSFMGLNRDGDGAAEARARFNVRQNAYTFRSLISVLMMKERAEEAANAVLALPLAHVPALSKQVTVATMQAIAEALDRRNEADLRARFLAALVERRYSGPYSDKVDDSLRMQHLTQLLDAGLADKAGQHLRFIETPSIFVALLADRRYAALWETAELKALTPQLMLARVQLRAQRLALKGSAENGDTLEAARALRATGDPQRAIDAVNGALLTPAKRKTLGRAARLLMIEKAYAFAELGRIAEARATFIAALDQFPDDPVLSRLAYGRVMEAAGEAQGALNIVSPLSPSGLPGPARAVALSITLCAAHQLGRSVEVNDAMAQLKELGLNAAPSMLEALLCQADDTGARAFVMSWLQSPAHRSSAIPALQLYAEPPHILPRLGDRRRRLTALIARADIQEALKPHGRSLGWSFTRANAIAF